MDANIRYAVLTLSAAAAFKAVTSIVNEPYLDEVFHIPQTQQFCVGNWSHWDSKITTPPGLYVLGVIYSRVLSLIRGYDYFCTTSTLRNLNVFGVMAAMPVAVRRVSDPNTAVALSAFPLLAFFGLLYYTDVWSTVFTLAAYAVGKKKTVTSRAMAGVLATISLTFRQTNIIWAGYTALLLVNVQSNTFMKQVVEVVKRAVTTPSLTLPFLATAGAFAAFVSYNGGIALGDKSNHQVSVNFPQMLYCVLFWGLFSWPLWLSPRFARRYVVSNFGTPIRAIITLFSMAAITAVVVELSVAHPFMLADNRHYTFYLWRRLIDHDVAKFGMVPVYHACIWAFTTTLYSSTTALNATALIVFTALAIVPSPLMEPRYYILPYAFWRILVNKHHQRRLYMEFAWYMLVNIITVYVFLFKPFTWSQEPGKLQRFMW